MADKSLNELLTTLANKVKALESTVSKLTPAVGDIEINVSGTNPETKYPGTTWKAWGSGRVPVGVDTAQTEFATVEKPGGGKTVSYTPAGTNEGTAISIAQMPQHSHAHTLSLNKPGAHTHALAGAGAAAQSAGAHIHSIAYRDNMAAGSNTGSPHHYEYANKTGILNTNSAGAHTHSLTGNTGGAGDHTHTISGSISNNGSGATHTHTFTGTSANISTLQPYITCYMWKRTA